eukprot:365981-Chlamydomonas_euryale.AAC.18
MHPWCMLWRRGVCVGGVHAPGAAPCGVGSSCDHADSRGPNIPSLGAHLLWGYGVWAEGDRVLGSTTRVQPGALPHKEG